MKYIEKLQDQRWKEKRHGILERDEYECQRCHVDEGTLQVHHLRYEGYRDPWEYGHHDLVTLCQPCHKVVTAYGIGQEEIKNPWITYSRAKKNIPNDLSAGEYTDEILSLSNELSL